MTMLPKSFRLSIAVVILSSVSAASVLGSESQQCLPNADLIGSWAFDSGSGELTYDLALDIDGAFRFHRCALLHVLTPTGCFGVPTYITVAGRWCTTGSTLRLETGSLALGGFEMGFARLYNDPKGFRTEFRVSGTLSLAESQGANAFEFVPILP